MEAVQSRRSTAHWPPWFFARIIDSHLRRTRSRSRLVGDGKCHLVSASALLEHVLPIMQQLARDHRAADELLGAEDER